MMLGKLFLLLSIVFFAMWLLTTYGQTIPILGKLGHLPGDIRVERNGLSLYLPYRFIHCDKYCADSRPASFKQNMIYAGKS